MCSWRLCGWGGIYRSGDLILPGTFSHLHTYAYNRNGWADSTGNVPSFGKTVWPMPCQASAQFTHLKVPGCAQGAWESQLVSTLSTTADAVMAAERILLTAH